MKFHHRPTTRGAFTLVELLVAVALIILLMTILSVAFSVALGTFRDLKAIGDMSDQLRSATTIIRRDLAADHFEDEASNTHRLSGINPSLLPWNGSKKGFLYLRQGSAPILEGADADSIPSHRSTACEFGMTVKLSAKTQSDTFAASATPLVRGYMGGNSLVDFSIVDAANNPLQVVSQWAEVYYFLLPTAVVTTEGGGPPLPLYTLYRRQRVLPSSTVVFPNSPPGNAVQATDVLNSSGLAFAQVPLPPMPVQLPQFMAVGPESLNNFIPGTAPITLVPTNRLGGWYDPLRPGYGALTQQGPVPPPPALFEGRPYPIPSSDLTNYGSDVVLNNVLSFRVQIQNAAGQFVDLTPPGPGQPAIFDTARPGAQSIRAMRIQLRVHHAKSNLTRQVTIIQDL